jgi:MoxR-like ATPase
MKYNQILEEVERVVRGKRVIAEYLLGALLAGGHALLEDIPGVGKTLLALTLARILGLSFKRFQFTSDTLPADILGSFIFDVKKNDFVFKPGPIFTNIFLADEINRTSPKTQSALLEAMAEGQVTVEGETFKLPQPFFVIATQNSLEEWGTFPLPQSELDRFMIRTSVGYPPKEIEKEILAGENPYGLLKTLSPLADKQIILLEREKVKKVKLPEESLNFAHKVVWGTRNHPDIKIGVSTRGALQWVTFSKALSHIRELDFVPVEILKECAKEVLAHRIVLKESATASAEDVIREILEEVKS